MRCILPVILLCLTGCHEPLRTPQDPPAVITAPAPLLSSPGILATVLSNHDGDSLTVMMNGQKVKVRLEGIDSPEIGQRHGSDSKSALASIIAGRRVTIAKTGTDRYGRTLARVYADGGDVGRAMVRLGWAMHFLRYKGRGPRRGGDQCTTGTAWHLVRS